MTELRLREDIRTALPKLPAAWYQTILADPPWAEVGGGKICRGAQGHYSLMKQKDLLELASQVKRVTAPDAHLYLWVTNTFLEDGLELARAWGFEYKTLITWGKDRFGLGQYFRGQTEQCIFAVKGVLPYKVEEGKRQQGRTLITAPRMEHSSKPLEMRTMIERVSYGPRLELFGRKVPAEWDAIGLELEDVC
jgi:N6-adenosine-specific RNA methylase IME4